MSTNKPNFSKPYTPIITSNGKEVIISHVLKGCDHVLGGCVSPTHLKYNPPLFANGILDDENAAWQLLDTIEIMVEDIAGCLKNQYLEVEFPISTWFASEGQTVTYKVFVPDVGKHTVYFGVNDMNAPTIDVRIGEYLLSLELHTDFEQFKESVTKFAVGLSTAIYNESIGQLFKNLLFEKLNWHVEAVEPISLLG